MARPPCSLSAGGSPTGGQTRLLAVAFFALFVSGLLSAPFTFVFATPAYVAICAAMILTEPRSRTEWAWKISALALCLIFIFASGLLDYYLGTIATAGRTPTAPIAWDRLLSAESWLHLFRDHSLCSDPRLLLCINDRGGWLLIAALCGAVLAIVTRRGDIRTAACRFHCLYRLSRTSMPTPIRPFRSGRWVCSPVIS